MEDTVVPRRTMRISPSSTATLPVHSGTGERLFHPSISHLLSVPVTEEEQEAVRLVDQARPIPLRKFDQISMVPEDLLRQVKVMAPLLDGQRVAFVGDLDSASLLLGLLTMSGGARPRSMLLLDFDARFLAAASAFAHKHGFASLLDVRLYNVFDRLPSSLRGEYDWFYTNPPYGKGNNGESARLFIARGCELTAPISSHGCIILPSDDERVWTRQAMNATQDALRQGGWGVSTMMERMHRYRLDDDTELTSALLVVDRLSDSKDGGLPQPYAGRRVPFGDIPTFYGTTVHPPYPRYVRSDGSFDDGWDDVEEYVA